LLEIKKFSACARAYSNIYNISACARAYTSIYNFLRARAHTRCNDTEDDTKE